MFAHVLPDNQNDVNPIKIIDTTLYNGNIILYRYNHQAKITKHTTIEYLYVQKIDVKTKEQQKELQVK